MLHLTVSNKEHPGLELLLESAKKHGIKTRVLGMGSQVKIGHGGKGFGLKLQLLKNELELLPPDTKVIFTDAYDVLFNDSSAKLEEWIEKNDEVLFAAEKAKWPDQNLFYPKIVFPFPYLNSGVIAGRAKKMLEFLQKPFDMKTDDQGYYSEQYVLGKGVLDHNAEFFLCLAQVDSLDKYKLPFVTHLNNGNTRRKYMRQVVSKILGPKYLHLANLVILKELYNYTPCIAFVVLFILLLWMKNYFWN